MNDSERKFSLAPTTLDRASFIVGLSAALLAFYPLKDSLKKFSVSIFIWNFSLYDTGLVFLGLLLFSAYLYGLNNIRYSIRSILEWEPSRYLETIALGVYIFAFLFPVLLLAVWILSFLLNLLLIWILLPLIQSLFRFSGNRLLTLNFLAGVVTGVLTVYTGYITGRFSFKISKLKNESAIQELEEKVEISEVRAENAYSKGDLKISLLSLYETLISELRANVIFRIGIGAQRLPNSQIIRIARDKGILRADEVAVVEDLRGIRNQIAHNVDYSDLTSESINSLRSKIKPIFNRLKRERLAARSSRRY